MGIGDITEGFLAVLFLGSFPGTTMRTALVMAWMGFLAAFLHGSALALEVPPVIPVPSTGDDPSDELLLVVPGMAHEGSGVQPTLGRVLRIWPSDHDVAVSLTSDAPVHVPTSVVIPAGRSTATFPIRMESDDFVNVSNRLAFVRAAAGSGPQVEAGIVVIDNDDPAISVMLPAYLVEGEAVTGTVRLRVPRDHPVTLTWQSDTPYLPPPPTTVVSPGTVEVAFTVKLLNNSTFDGVGSASLCARLGDVPAPCVSLLLLDDEADVRGVEFQVPNAVFSDEPRPVQMRLRDWYGATARTNLTGLARLDMDPQVARFEPQPFSMAFSNGLYHGDLIFSGEALRAGVELQVAGSTFHPGQIDVLRGHTVRGPFTDLVAYPGHSRLLALGGGTTNSSTHLIEIDADTGATRRSLELDQAAHRLAVSDDGTVAWLAGTNGSLRRMDLIDWRTDAVVFLTNSARPARPEAVLVLAGETDRLLVLIRDLGNDPPGTVQDIHAIAVIDGIRRGPSVVIRNAGRPGHLLAGRTTAEAIVDWGGTLQTLVVGDDGVFAQAQVAVGYPRGFNPNLIRVDDLLYRGTGEILSLDPLALIRTHPRGEWVALAEGTKRLGYLDADGGFRVVAATTLEVMGQHAVPWTGFGEARTMVRWADGGFAVLEQPSANVVIWRSPLVAQPVADLAVLGQAPESHVMTYPGGFPAHNEVVMLWTVTNRGPGVAYDVELVLSTGAHRSFGSLAAGEARTVTAAEGVAAPSTLRRTAVVTSQSPDPNPENNSARLRTDVFEPTLGNIRRSLLDARDLTMSADGQRLWIAVAPPLQEGGGALLEMDPGLGAVDRRIALEALPEQVVATADGRFLYVRLETSQLMRWNLDAQAADFTVTFTNETVLDLLPLPWNTRGVVVATSRRIVVLEDATMRPEVIGGAAETRHLGFAGEDLWVAQPGQLRRCRIVPTGVVADGEPTPLFVPASVYSFAGDSRRLYFEGLHHNLATGEIRPSPLGGPFLPDPERGLVYAASGRRLLRYDASTFGLLAEESLPGMGSMTVAMVRWGRHGLAMLDQSGMVWTCEPSVVPDSGGGDIGVGIVGPTLLTDAEPMEWVITITNSAAEPATRSTLTLQRTGEFVDPSVVGYTNLNYLGATYLDLGDLPPHSSTSLRFRARVTSQHHGLRATVTTAAAADWPGNNTAEVFGSFGPAFADIGVRLLAPPVHDLVHQTVALRVLVTNTGPSTASAVQLELTAGSAVGLVSVSPGSVINATYASLGPVEAGTSREVEVNVRRPDPGLTAIALSFTTGSIDTQRGNNRIHALLDVRHEGPATGVRRFEYPRGHSVWSERRQELVAVFDGHPALVILGPESLDLRSEIPLPDPPRQVAVARDGKTAWVALMQGDVAEIDLELRSMVSKFPCEIHTSIPWGAFASVDAAPGILVAAGASSRGEPRVIAYRDGLPLPSTLEGLQWSGDGFFLAPSTEGHLFVSSGLELREVKVDGAGITEVRTLDSAATLGGALSFHPGFLAFSKGRVIDLATLQAKDDLLSDATLLVDSAVPALYRCRPARSFSPEDFLTVESFELGTLKPLWKVELPGDEALRGDSSQVVTLGRHGLLLVTTQALRVPAEVAGAAQADLALNLQPPDAPWFAGVDQPVSLHLNQRGAWTARNAVLEVEISGSVDWIEPALALEDGRGVLSLGDLQGGTRLTLVLRPSEPGDGTLRLRLRSDLPDPNPADNTLEWRVRVPSTPVLVLDDAPITEGTGPLDLRSVHAVLSSPAPSDWDHPFRVTPRTAQSADFTALEGLFRFPRGATTSSIWLIQGDTLPERSETFLLELLPGPGVLARTSVVLTLEDDDLPVLTPLGLAVQEGNQGVTQAGVAVVMSEPAGYPVEVHYQTRAGTATSGVDYQEVSGWLRFEPGQRTNHVLIPILGDVDYEPDERLEVLLTEAPTALLTRQSAIVTLLNDDPAPAPALVLRQEANGAWRVHFDTVDGARYRLQVRDHLGEASWGDLGAHASGTGRPASFPIPDSVPPPRFFRVRMD